MCNKTRVDPLDIDCLAKTIGELLQQRHLTLAVAESCTGGLLAARITDIPGSSAYFEGGVVTYSYQAKERVLGVPPSTLEVYGAVSAETAIAMA
ncbi:MAG: CinA family protein, partial [Chloroflexi bacterium]|nr:CinA family protein [Chloroflexota bacterium]